MHNEFGSSYGEWSIAEAVPSFNQSRRSPLIVLLSFDDGKITHIADGRKSISAGSGLSRLNMKNLEQLKEPVAFETLLRKVSGRSLENLQRVLYVGGVLPPKTMADTVNALVELDPSLSRRLSRFSESRAQKIASIPKRSRENLAFQKESLTAALDVAGLSSEPVLGWSPGEEPTSFLDGLEQTYAREDVMLHADLTSLPGFSALKEAPFLAAKTFGDDSNPFNRVTVVMANRLRLEEQTGADLIYYNETYKSFVLVQYKAFAKQTDKHEFRWKAGDQFEKELGRMDEFLEELAKADPDTDPDGFRLTANPFFLKFCPRVIFNPDDKGLFPGLYLPHGLWKMLASSGRLKGEAGGNLLTYENVGRRVSNTDFVILLRGAWVGTTINQSTSLERLIRQVLQTGRTVTFAVKRSPPPEAVDMWAPIENEPPLEEGIKVSAVE